MKAAVCDEHNYEPLIHGHWDSERGPVEEIVCQDCGHRMELIAEVWANWQAHYDDCVREDRVYQGILGFYFPPGYDHPPMA